MGLHVLSSLVVLGGLLTLLPSSAVGSAPGRYYERQAELLKRNDRTTMEIDFDHLSAFDDALSTMVFQNFYRLEPYMRRAVSQFMLEVEPEYSRDEHSQMVSHAAWGCCRV